MMTAREKEVLGLIVEGRFNKKIAYELTISENTVRAHIRSLMKETGARNRTELAVNAVRKRLLVI